MDYDEDDDDFIEYEEEDEDEDPGRIVHRFELSMEFNDDGSLEITLGGVRREHMRYMFSTTIADIITTTMMDLETRTLHGDFDDEVDEDG